MASSFAVLAQGQDPPYHPPYHPPYNPPIRPPIGPCGYGVDPPCGGGGGGGSGSGDSGGGSAGTVFGIIIGIFAIFGVIFFCLRANRRDRAVPNRENLPSQIQYGTAPLVTSTSDAM